MQLRFLGTGTSMGVPVIGCSCAVCSSSDPRNRRTRTSALLRINGQTILIDAGVDFRTQALAARLEQVDAVLLTHSHFDHVSGLDDLRPLCERTGVIPVYGSAQTLADVRERFSYAFNSTSEGSTRPKLELCSIDGPFQIGQTQIIPFEIMHGTWSITGFRIGTLGYVTDASFIPEISMQQLSGLDVLVLNALRYEPHPTHFSLSQALEIVKALGPQRTFFVHMTHAFDHETASAQLPAGVAFAYDGLELALDDPQLEVAG